MKSFNELSKEIHEQNKARGWWDKPRTAKTLAMLCITELAEGVEGDRKNTMDEHLPHRTSREVELADFVIRVLDLAGHNGVDCDAALLGIGSIVDAPYQDHMFDLVKMTCKLATLQSWQYSIIIRRAEVVAKKFGLDLWGAVDEKLEYNKTRRDHDRAARSERGGKRY